MLPRRTARSALAWLLPWLVARLLLPPGVMPAAPAGEPGWILCSAAVALGAGVHRDAPPGNGGAHHESAPCPFTLAGACAAPPVVLAAAAPRATASLAIPAAPGQSWPRRPSRAHPARGPPAFS